MKKEKIKQTETSPVGLGLTSALLPAESLDAVAYLGRSSAGQCPASENCPLWLEFSPRRYADKGLRLVLTLAGLQRVKDKYLKNEHCPSVGNRSKAQEEPSFDIEKCTDEILAAFSRLKVVSDCQQCKLCLDRARCALLGESYPYISYPSYTSFINCDIGCELATNNITQKKRK
ncbi:MAG: hypothetical protein L3J71_03620 [Victivallaceae bacterium]|nr:hypothetical protein [Victivallaceae bacterium]